MSILTTNTVCSGISGQLPVVRHWTQSDGRSYVSRSQPAGLCSKALPFGGRRSIILKSRTRDLALKCSLSSSQPFGGRRSIIPNSRTRDLTLKCSLSSSQPLGTNIESLPFGGKKQCTMNTRAYHSLICFSALNARCGAEQTQTITRESSTITVAPVDGKADLSPKIDDGGSGFPPRDDGDGGGGGGGGGGNWSGGFFFFGFLAFLGLLKDREKEGPYDD